jgi:elongation factor P
MVILVDGALFRITDVTHVTPGNWRGMVQLKAYNLKNNNCLERRLRSDESVDVVQLDRNEMEFLYAVDDMYTFMDTKTYEQIDIPLELLGTAVNYLLPNTTIKVALYEGRPIGIELPITVELEIVETDPPLRGATASGSPKSAKLETGIIVKVPRFLQVGDVVRIDTRDNSFVERAAKK